MPSAEVEAELGSSADIRQSVSQSVNHSVGQFVSSSVGSYWPIVRGYQCFLILVNPFNYLAALIKTFLFVFIKFALSIHLENNSIGLNPNSFTRSMSNFQ